jgi:hypothetical protein
MADDSLAKALTAALGGVGGAIAVVVLNKLAEKSGETLFGLLKKAAGAGLGALARLLRGDRLVERYRRVIPDTYGRHVLTQKRIINVSELYVDLQYVQADSRHDLLSYVAGQRAVLVLGEAGAGKSLLMKSFLLKWAADRSRAAKARIPVLVELHRCNAESTDFIQLIADRYTRSRDRGAAKAKEFVEDRLAKGGFRVLFDGLDEVSIERQQAVATALRGFRERYAGDEGENVMVVTCRGSAYTGQLGDAFQKVEIAEFDDAAILRFLDKWLTSERATGRTAEEIEALGTAEEIFEQIRRNPLLINLARNPLLLSLIADLYTVKVAGRGGTLPAFRSELYGEITDHLVNRDPLLGRPAGSSSFDPADKLTVLKRVALVMTETSPAEGDRLVIASEQLDEAIRDALMDRNLNFESGRKLLREIVERSQLLARSENGERYWFAHRSFQEYFTARALEGRRHIVRLLDGYWSDPDFWRDTVRFWCGLPDLDCTDVVADIFHAEEPRNRVLALECLTDAREIDGTLAGEIIGYFMRQLADAHDDPDLEGVVAAFGTVAAGSGLRSEGVFKQLKERAERGEPPAMEALARSGRDAAARLLARHAEDHDVAARMYLRDMGEAAVPALAGVAERGKRWAIDALGEIGTPAAAVRLSALVWQEESKAVYRAAWWLAALLTRPSVELALRDRDGARGRRPDLPIHSYAWDPFRSSDAAEGRFTDLVGRISFLLDPRGRDEDSRERARAQLPAEIQAIDPRLGLQLAALNLAAEWQTNPAEGPDRARNLYDQWEEATGMARPLRRRHGDREAPELGQVMKEIFDLNGISPYTRLLVGLLPEHLQVSVVSEPQWRQLGYGSGPLDVPAWSRAAKDTEHKTDLYWGVGVVALLVLALGGIGIGMARAVGTAGGWWPWGPAWLSWATLALVVLGGLALPAASWLPTPHDDNAAVVFLFAWGLALDRRRGRDHRLGGPADGLADRGGPAGPADRQPLPPDPGGLPERAGRPTVLVAAPGSIWLIPRSRTTEADT